MDITDRFAELARGPEERCRLDEGALLIAAHARRDLDVDEQIARLDDLAAGCPGRDLEAVAGHLFDVLDFRGDTDDYASPANSLLDVVLDRRRGIPITLSVVAIEVGRRVGVPLEGVGMPGHFLVGASDGSDRFLDPFHQALLDRDGCAALFAKVHGSNARFDDRFLDPVGPAGGAGPHADQPAAVLRRAGRQGGRAVGPVPAGAGPRGDGGGAAPAGGDAGRQRPLRRRRARARRHRRGRRGRRPGPVRGPGHAGQAQLTGTAPA